MIGRCLLGCIMVGLAHVTGSFAWMARLLGYMGIANGTAAWQENKWLQFAHQISMLAVAVFGIQTILALTGFFVLSDRTILFLTYIFLIPCMIFLIMGLFFSKKEDNQ